MSSPNSGVNHSDLFQEEMNLWRSLRECPWNQVSEYLERKTNQGFSSNFIDEIGELLSIIQKQEESIKGFQENFHSFKQKTYQKIEEKQLEIDQLVLANSDLNNDNYLYSYTYGELTEKYNNLLRRNKVLEQEILELEKTCETSKSELFFAKENIATLQRQENLNPNKQTHYNNDHQQSTDNCCSGSTSNSFSIKETQIRNLFQEKERLLLEEIEKLSERNLHLVEQHQNYEKKISSVDAAWKKAQAENRVLREEFCKLFDSNTKESSFSGVRRRKTKTDEAELLKTKEKTRNKNTKRSHSSYYTPRSKRKAESFVDDETRMKLKMLEEIGDEEEKTGLSERSFSYRRSGKRFLSSIKLDFNWGLVDKSQLLESISLNELSKSSLPKNPARHKAGIEALAHPRAFGSEVYSQAETQSLEPKTLRQSLAELWPSYSIDDHNFNFFKEVEGSTIFEENLDAVRKSSKSVFSRGNSNTDKYYQKKHSINEEVSPDLPRSLVMLPVETEVRKEEDNEICEYDEGEPGEEKLIRTIDFQREEIEVKKSEEFSEAKKKRHLRRSPTADNFPAGRKKKGCMRYMTEISSAQDLKRRNKLRDSKERVEIDDAFIPLMKCSQMLQVNTSISKGGSSGSFNGFNVSGIMRLKQPAQINHRVTLLNQQLNLLIETKMTLVKKLSKEIIDTLRNRQIIAQNLTSGDFLKMARLTNLPDLYRPHKERITQILEKANLLRKIGTARDRALLDLKGLSASERINPTHFAFLLYLFLAPMAFVQLQYKRLGVRMKKRTVKKPQFRSDDKSSEQKVYAYFIYIFLLFFNLLYRNIFNRNKN